MSNKTARDILFDLQQATVSNAIKPDKDFSAVIKRRDNLRDTALKELEESLLEQLPSQSKYRTTDSLKKAVRQSIHNFFNHKEIE